MISIAATPRSFHVVVAPPTKRRRAQEPRIRGPHRPSQLLQRKPCRDTACRSTTRRLEPVLRPIHVPSFGKRPSSHQCPQPCIRRAGIGPVPRTTSSFRSFESAGTPAGHRDYSRLDFCPVYSDQRPNPEEHSENWSLRRANGRESVRQQIPDACSGHANLAAGAQFGPPVVKCHIAARFQPAHSGRRGPANQGDPTFAVDLARNFGAVCVAKSRHREQQHPNREPDRNRKGWHRGGLAEQAAGSGRIVGRDFVFARLRPLQTVRKGPAVAFPLC